MSLLTETVKTVIEGNNLIVGNTVNNQYVYQPNPRGYFVLTGAVEPRGLGNYLLLDNVTGEPVQLPPNTLTYKGFFLPTIPMESTDLTDSQIKLYLYDDTSFSNSYDNWGSNGRFTGEELNSKAVTEMTDVSGTFSDQAGYSYPGLEVENREFTAGQLQVYIYYIRAQTPVVV